MNRYIYILVFSFMLLSACNKSKDDFGGDGSISGRAYLQDSFGGTGVKIPRANQAIKIQYSDGDTSNAFLYSVESDANGYFNFANLNKDRKYLVFFEYDSTGTSNPLNIFYGSQSFAGNNSSAEVIATPDNKKQNGLCITAVDKYGGALQNVTVYLYSSRVLAEADTTTIAGTGSTLTLTTDSRGRAFKCNVGTDSIYINAKGVYGNTVLTTTVPTRLLPLNPHLTSVRLDLK